MREELDFIRQALDDDSGIKFETPIAFIIPQMPTASLFGDSSLLSCGGYSIKLRIWWFLPFPEEIVQKNLAPSQKQQGSNVHINQLLGIHHDHSKLLCCSDGIPQGF